MALPNRALAQASLFALACGAGFAQTAPAFEVADVKVNNSGPGAMQAAFLPSGQITVRNMPLRDLIVQAYKAAGVAGGPAWLDSSRFDVIAKAPPNTPTDTLRVMLQPLLAERFKLAIHTEQRPTPVYALIVAKGGSKLQAAAGSSPPKCAPGQGVEGQNHTVCTNFTMADLAEWLPTRLAPSFIDRPVVNLTGIQGAYDIRLDWVPRPLSEISDAPAGPTVFDALEKQLGLKLEDRKQPMPVIVIDHIEQVPAEN
jgi:uncharacterized protein (TIGR03435 family)